MEELQFEITDSPSSADLEFLTKKINQDTEDLGAAYPFAIFIRNPAGNIIGGCNGSVIFGTIYTDQLWVDPALRRQGVGKKLMERVHAHGIKHGCKLATVATMDFQAPHFYEKLGYTVDFSRPGYNKDATCVFMSRKLHD